MTASRFATFLESFHADPKTRGTQWEHVCKWFLETNDVYRGELKTVWLWDAWSGRWGPDTGIDLVAQAKDDTLWAIQAKCYDPKSTVTLDDMNKFFGASNRQFEYEGGIRHFSQRLLIATTDQVSKHARESSQWAEKPVALYLRWQPSSRACGPLDSR